MMRKHPGWVAAIGTIFILAALGLLTWANYRYAEASTGPNDFIGQWFGTRALLIDGTSPYSDETAQRIQILAYGRVAQEGEDQLRVAYPVYAVIFFFPYALINDITLARALWLTTLEAGVLLLTYLSIRLTQWKPKFWMLAGVFLFSILWYHGVNPVINGNAIVLVAVLVAGALLAIRTGADELAGVLLAFSTIKPQVVALLIIYVFYWSLKKRRYRLVAWLVGTEILLVLGGLFLLPDWILQNLREVIRYTSYNPLSTMGAVLSTWSPALGVRVGYAVSFLLALLLMNEWFRSARYEFRGFLWVACLTLTASQWIGIPTDPGNYLVLFPAIVFVFALWTDFLRGQAGGVIGVTMAVLLLLIWLAFTASALTITSTTTTPGLFLALPAMTFILLFWVRGWAMRPQPAWFDQGYDLDQTFLR